MGEIRLKPPVHFVPQIQLGGTSLQTSIVQSWVIQLGLQLEEFFLTPVNHTVFLLVLYSHKLCEFKYMNGSILYCIPIYSL